MTRKIECVSIENMIMDERTKRYTTRRIVELQGHKPARTLDERTQKYISRRLSEIRDGVAPAEKATEHPYILRRLAQLRRGDK